MKGDFRAKGANPKALAQAEMGSTTAEHMVLERSSAHNLDVEMAAKGTGNKRNGKGKGKGLYCAESMLQTFLRAIGGLVSGCIWIALDPKRNLATPRHIYVAISIHYLPSKLCVPL